METVLKTEVGGKPLSIETGKVAKQASGSVVVRYGDTMVLVTVVSTMRRTRGGFFAADRRISGKNLCGRTDTG